MAFTVLLDYGQRVEPLVYCLDDFRRPRYFLSMIRESGKEVYSLPEEEIARREAETDPAGAGTGTGKRIKGEYR